MEYYITECSFIALFIIVMYFFFVETQGYALEEIAVLFDGEEDFTNMVNMHAAEMEKNDRITVEHIEDNPGKDTAA